MGLGASLRPAVSSGVFGDSSLWHHHRDSPPGLGTVTPQRDRGQRIIQNGSHGHPFPLRKPRFPLRTPILPHDSRFSLISPRSPLINPKPPHKPPIFPHDRDLPHRTINSPHKPPISPHKLPITPRKPPIPPHRPPISLQNADFPSETPNSPHDLHTRLSPAPGPKRLQPPVPLLLYRCQTMTTPGPAHPRATKMAAHRTAGSEATPTPVNRAPPSAQTTPPPTRPCFP